MKQVSAHPLRCTCSRQPILAFYGLTDKNTVYLHVKVYKARRVFGEILVLSGECELRCRECFRWYKVVIPVSGRPQLIEAPEPEPVEEDIDRHHA